MTLYHGGTKIETGGIFEGTDFPNGIATLESYAYSKKVNNHMPYIKNIFFDSGAFSAFSRGLKISLQEYIDFIHKNKDKITVYASLDVIGNEYESWKNYKEMRKQGLNPLPAFHKGEHLKWIEKYLKYTDYIGLGGIAKSPRKKKKLFLDKVFTQYPNVSKVKFHGYGITDKTLMQRYPWYTVDSTSATLSSGMGSIITPWGSKAMTNRHGKGVKFSENVETKIREYCSKYNLNFENLSDDGNPGYAERIKFSVQYIEKLFKTRPQVFKTETHYLI